MSGDDDDKKGWWQSLSGGYRNSSTNLRIMIIAIISLSCVVLLFLALHIYARVVLLRRASRRRAATIRRLGVAQLQSAVFPKPGLSPAVVAALPTFRFKNLKPNGGDRGDDVTMECSVCLSLLEEEELVRQLPNCKHAFHVECVDKWLEFNTSCPLCRAEAEPVAVEPTAPPAGVEPSELSQPPAVSKEGAAAASVASTSRLSSFRRMLSGDRSSKRHVQPSAPLEVELSVEAGDAERQ